MLLVDVDCYLYLTGLVSALTHHSVTLLSPLGNSSFDATDTHIHESVEVTLVFRSCIQIRR